MLSRTLTFFVVIVALTVTSCSESSSSEDEYANWKERNELFLASVANDSLQKPGWLRLKCFSLDENTEGTINDYVYAKVVSSAYQHDEEVANVSERYETGCPAYTDSVRVSYQGRLIPTATYPEGKVFDGTVYGTYNDKTNSSTKFRVAGLTAGFSTALQHMHRGDHWRIYIPAALGYGESGSGTAIPGHSVIIFELTLIDFSPAGEAMPVWSARTERQ
jgi:FKBP-type peptidyl-prolyl cis-trans isomerase FklB